MRVFIIVLIIFSLLSIFGLRVAHPNAGLKSALGSAKSSVVFYWRTASVQKGNKIVAVSTYGKKERLLAIVNNVTNNSIDIQAGNTLQRISNKEIMGKLIMVIPFIGYPLNVFGF